MRAVVSLAAKDVCNDCGHSKNCCIATQDAEMMGALSIAPSTQALPVAETCFFADPEYVPVEPASNWYVNKAPPWQIKPSPVSLHQKLSV